MFPELSWSEDEKSDNKDFSVKHLKFKRKFLPVSVKSEGPDDQVIICWEGRGGDDQVMNQVIIRLTGEHEDD